MDKSKSLPEKVLWSYETKVELFGHSDGSGTATLYKVDGIMNEQGPSPNFSTLPQKSVK